MEDTATLSGGFFFARSLQIKDGHLLRQYSGYYIEQNIELHDQSRSFQLFYSLIHMTLF